MNKYAAVFLIICSTRLVQPSHNQLSLRDAVQVTIGAVTVFTILKMFLSNDADCSQSSTSSRSTRNDTRQADAFGQQKFALGTPLGTPRAREDDLYDNSTIKSESENDEQRIEQSGYGSEEFELQLNELELQKAPKDSLVQDWLEAVEESKQDVNKWIDPVMLIETRREFGFFICNNRLVELMATHNTSVVTADIRQKIIDKYPEPCDRLTDLKTFNKPVKMGLNF